MDQQALWEQANRVKQRVLNTLGGDLNALSYAFRSTPAFLEYIAMCGEVQVDYNAGELNQELLVMLEDAARRVEEQWARGMR